MYPSICLQIFFLSIYHLHVSSILHVSCLYSNSIYLESRCLVLYFLDIWTLLSYDISRCLLELLNVCCDVWTLLLDLCSYSEFSPSDSRATVYV
jgi:hypothetical protein